MVMVILVVKSHSQDMFQGLKDVISDLVEDVDGLLIDEEKEHALSKIVR